MKKLNDTAMAKVTGTLAQAINFAVSGQTLKAFLDASGINYQSAGMISFGKSGSRIAEMARKWTTAVECYR